MCYGIPFTDNRPVDEEAEAAEAVYWATQDRPRIYRWHSFDWACEQNKIAHHPTKPRCPWTNGQVERMNRTIKDATVKRYHYVSHDDLRHHLQLFVEA
jgi:transposase InsO family protein